MMLRCLLLLSLAGLPGFEFPAGTLLHDRYEDWIAGRVYRAEAVQVGQTLVVIVRLDEPYPDFDGDQDVDQSDFGAMQAQLGTDLGHTTSPCDLNSDGEIGPADVELFARWPRRARVTGRESGRAMSQLATK